MNDPFLEEIRVKTEHDAMKNSIKAALQRNKTYKKGVGSTERAIFRREWERLICEESKLYTKSVSDAQHCKAIQRISDRLSEQFSRLLHDRLRYGTSQKAFNLYLKFLWRLKMIVCPPHCPVDRIVLTAGGIGEAWTKCNNREQYMRWIENLRRAARRVDLAQWEYDVWLSRRP